MADITETTDASFESDVLKSDVPVVVDLWATWCQPCKALSPLLDAVATEMDGQVKVVKLDIQANPKTPASFGVTSIPTLLVFKGGELVARQVGNPGTKGKVKSFVEGAL